MRDDPVIDAVREVRHRISESVGHDPYRLVAYYRQRQERRRDGQLPQLGGTTAGSGPVPNHDRRPSAHDEIRPK